jgi:hypothetical protein
MSEVSMAPADGPGYVTSVPRRLHDGEPVPSNPFHADWITMVIIGSAIIYAVVATFARHLFSDMIKVVTLGAVGKPVSDARGIFQWQNTLANLASFTNISLFLCLYTLHYESWFPIDAGGVLRWLMIFTAISLLITLRHFVSYLTGAMSSSINAFSDYLNNIYIIYRVLGAALLPVLVAISFLRNAPVGPLLNAGVVVVIIVFIVRIIRLLNIFIENHVSIFYFILYLCALEILPGAILFKILAT